MVSIPDWAKFSRSTESGHKPDTATLLNKYYKQRELEAIKQAEQTGYFLVPSKDYLLKHVGPYSGTNKELTKIFLVRLVGLHLRKLGDIPLCSSLQICILPNNFLTKIDVLSSCQQLVKLDLHGNQVCVSVCVSVCVCVCAHMHAHVCVCVCMCVCEKKRERVREYIYYILK